MSIFLIDRNCFHNNDDIFLIVILICYRSKLHHELFTSFHYVDVDVDDDDCYTYDGCYWCYWSYYYTFIHPMISFLLDLTVGGSTTDIVFYSNKYYNNDDMFYFWL